MNIYIKRVNAATAFLTGRGISEKDVLSLDVARVTRIHLYGQTLPGITWESKTSGPHVHHTAEVVQDGVPITLVAVTRAVVAA